MGVVVLGVVALGGGAVLDEQTQAALADHRVVLLTVRGDTAGGGYGVTVNTGATGPAAPSCVMRRLSRKPRLAVVPSWTV